MLDGLYQSVICFYMAYCLFLPGNFVTSNGLSLDERERFGAYIGPAAVVCINVYILLNTYRWDWLMILLVSISILLVWFWTGVYSSFTSSDYFYKAAAEVFGEATFWAVTSLSVILSLLPRFFIKTIQKVYFPYDVDIVREQVRQGKFDYLDAADGNDEIPKGSSSTSSDIASRVSTPTIRVLMKTNDPFTHLQLPQPLQHTILEVTMVVMERILHAIGCPWNSLLPDLP
jgi:phospholipid-translocating ATPase